jgi:hypothetical protein
VNIVPPSTWRVVGRADTPESYIPLAPGHRGRAILQRMKDGPTEEERMARAERDQARALARHQRKIRHLALLSLHDGLVRRLLEEHAPHETEYGGMVHEECHGCAQGYDSEYGDFCQSWPCPTWRTISDTSS